MEKETSVYDISKKITVLNAIFWIKAAVKEIKKATVSNCFKKCGFPIARGEDIISNVDLEEDLQNLINVSCGAHFLAKDYINIDKELEIEVSSDNLSELVQQTKAEENDLSDDEEEEPRAISSAEVEECFQKLRHYFLMNKDAHGLEESANLQMHFENMQSKKPKTQKSITDYFK